MPSPPAGYSAFRNLVVPAALPSDLTPRYRNRMLDMCFNGYVGTYGEAGQVTTIHVPIVDEANVSNIASGSIRIADLATRPLDILLTNKESVSKRIESFDTIRTPDDMRQAYMGPAIESVLRKCNRVLIALATPTNFPDYPTIAGSMNSFSRLNIATAWSNVGSIGAAPLNPDHTFFLCDHVPYGRMMGDIDLGFIAQHDVGDEASVSAQQKGVLMPDFDARMEWDQMVPTTTPGKHGALFFHRLAIGLLPVLEKDPPPESFVHQMVVFPTWDRLFPVTIQFWKDPEGQGFILHVFATFGWVIVMPGYGSYMETT